MGTARRRIGPFTKFRQHNDFPLWTFPGNSGASPHQSVSPFVTPMDSTTLLETSPRSGTEETTAVAVRTHALSKEFAVAWYYTLWIFESILGSWWQWWVKAVAGNQLSYD